MKKRKLGRISAMVAASAMMMSLFGMNVSATEGVVTGEKITSVPITKTVTTDGNTYAPDTTFNFSVEMATEGDFEGNLVYAGVEGGLVAENGATFRPSGDAPAASYEAEGSLKVNVAKFSKPGVYHYTVRETAGTYSGITYDDSFYDVYVYVYVDDNNDMYVGNVVSVKNGAKTGLAFTNDYGKDNDGTHDLKVTKTIQGNQAVIDQKFDFTVQINGTAGEWYKVVVKENSNTAGTESKIVSGAEAVTYQITNGGSIEIYGLSDDDTYTVVETAANEDGYTTTIDSSATKDGKATGVVTKDGTVISYVNEKNAVTPTGVIMTIAPYVLIVAVAGVLAVLFLRRRRSF